MSDAPEQTTRCPHGNLGAINCGACEGEIIPLSSQMTEDALDAKRYRWLREHAEMIDMPHYRFSRERVGDCQFDLDGMIDAEMSRG